MATKTEPVTDESKAGLSLQSVPEFPAHALYAPIVMPAGLANSNGNTAASTTDGMQAGNNKTLSDMQVEETTTSAFIHAACRLHEATSVATAVATT
ncbi:hypothetical protein SCUCBS95973_006039 [Sporothrix curviconia]|uniref:Uncharacterized protein n=1 Tax=Sporothrix curviconia TaxID=1260050 RepID=A0ABP0C244_9PEZI